MPQHDPDPADREERLDRVIAEFLDEVRDGPRRPTAGSGWPATPSSSTS